MQTKTAISFIMLLSAAVIGFLVWLIYYREIPEGPIAAWAYYLPALNSFFNTISATCVVTGIVLIKRGKTEAHKKAMISATVASALFLVSYVIYHNMVGHVKFEAEGAIKTVYLSILASHILLSVAVVPMILTTLFFAWKDKLSEHKKLARWTWPVWLYVSVTGVLIFIMLELFNTAA